MAWKPILPYKHTAKSVVKYFSENKINVLEWVAQSSDMNPIEHIWKKIKTDLSGIHATSIRGKKSQIIAAWNKIDPVFTRDLVKSMPRRLQKLINQNGAPTGY